MVGVALDCPRGAVVDVVAQRSCVTTPARRLLVLGCAFMGTDTTQCVLDTACVWQHVLLERCRRAVRCTQSLTGWPFTRRGAVGRADVAGARMGEGGQVWRLYRSWYCNDIDWCATIVALQTRDRLTQSTPEVFVQRAVPIYAAPSDSRAHAVAGRARGNRCPSAQAEGGSVMPEWQRISVMRITRWHCPRPSTAL